MVHRTIVTLHTDGSQTVRELEVAKEQALQERAAFSGHRQPAGGAPHPLITHDPSEPTCNGADLWIFDHTNAAQGTGTFPFDHELCFYNEGNGGCAHLNDYVRFCERWSNQLKCVDWAAGYNSSVASFFSGASGGYFTGSDGFYTGTASFGTYQRVDDTSAEPWYFAQHAQFVCF
jgi:hypothetical protein